MHRTYQSRSAVFSFVSEWPTPVAVFRVAPFHHVSPQKSHLVLSVAVSRRTDK
jgi:hypothetical protein